MAFFTIGTLIVVAVWAKKAYKASKLFQAIRHAYAIGKNAKKLKFAVKHWDDAKRVAHITYKDKEYLLKVCKGGAKGLGHAEDSHGVVTVAAKGGGQVPAELAQELMRLYKYMESSWGYLYHQPFTAEKAVKVLTTVGQFLAPW
ncbi:MAG: hypothetical protein JRH20_05015 [Deltaproteobacteria bacterium]|nr:hypothetical protein [Deltaproteobacteria bacterium]